MLLLVLQAAVCWAQTEGTDFALTGDERPQAGDSLRVVSAGGLNGFSVSWTRGDALGVFEEEVLSEEGWYVIGNCDYEHWLRATVCNEAGNVVYTKDTWVSKLPVLYIDTEGGKPVTSKTTYLTANLRIQGNAEFEPQYNGVTEIRGRGVTSWASYPQKPYKLKLDKKTKLFGFGKSKHWVLVSNFNDKSCMRNYVSGMLAKELGVLSMGMTWVDVVLNGEVMGCYMLSQHVRVDKNSVDIFDWEGEAEDVADALFLAVKETEALEDSDEKLLEETMASNLAWVTDGKVTLKGKTYCLSDYGLKKEYDIGKGYLFEASQKVTGVTHFLTPQNVNLEVTAPEYLSTNEAMYSFVKDFWRDFEAEYSRVPTAEGKDFSKYADMESMVGIWLVNEIMGQGDPTNSRYSYIAADGKLHFGPAWDFDHAGSSWSTSQSTSSFYTLKPDRPHVYYKRWFPDPELCLMAFDAYWNVARPFIMDYVSEGGEMDKIYASIEEAGRTNDTLWGSYSCVAKPSALPRTTAEDVAIFRKFLLGHIGWMDKWFQSVRTLIETMNSLCTYPCDPDIIDGIASPKPSPQGKGFNKFIKDKHLYIIKDGETYSIDGKRDR